LSSIDCKFDDLMRRRHGNDPLLPMLPVPKWNEPWSFCLDDNFLHEVMDFSKKVTPEFRKAFPDILDADLIYEVIKLPTGVPRNFWQSPATHWIRVFSKHLRIAQRLELCLIAALHNGCTHCWCICGVINKHMNKNEKLMKQFQTRPSLVFCHCSLLMFGMCAFSSNDPRFNAHGADYVGTAFEEDNLDLYLMKLNVFCQWMHSEEDKHAKDDMIPLRLVQGKFQEVTNGLKHVASLELGEFKLALFVQLIVHARAFDRKPTSFTRDLVYPVSGKSSMKHLEVEGFFKLSPEMLDAILDLVCQRFGLSTAVRDSPETMLCESSPDRVNFRNNFYPKGMTMSRQDERGLILEQEHSNHNWTTCEHVLEPKEVEKEAGLLDDLLTKTIQMNAKWKKDNAEKKRKWSNDN